MCVRCDKVSVTYNSNLHTRTSGYGSHHFTTARTYPNFNGRFFFLDLAPTALPGNWLNTFFSCLRGRGQHKDLPIYGVHVMLQRIAGHWAPIRILMLLHSC